MDVSEFLRLSARESSLQSQRLMQRSAGDGEDSPACGTLQSILEQARSPAAHISGGQLPALVPPSGELAGIKQLTPYKIEVTPKMKHGSVKKKKEQTSLTSMAEVKQKVVSETIETSTTADEPCKTDNIATENYDENSFTSSLVMDRVNDLVKTLSKEAVISPLDSDLLNSPPEAMLNKAKISITPKPEGVPVTKHSSVKYTKLTRKLYKEPKFVPYEPYKGCADQMFGDKPCKKAIKKEFALTSQPSLPEVTATPGVHKDQDKKARAKLEMVVKDFETERCVWDKQVNETTARCEQLERELAKSKREKITLEDQLNVQAQVNGELKKLLVASVGEDVQGRVHCLTEDKARMANMIRRYSDKLDRDYEERERMSIQCDVWKSKFLASSVLVEELGSWKASLLRWTAEASEALSVLLDELQFVRAHTRRAYTLLDQLVSAFDPLRGSTGSSTVSIGGDGVSVSLAVADQVQALHQRLLGPLVAPPPSTGGLNDNAHSPGEIMASQVLDRREACMGYPGYAGSTSGVRVPQGHPLHTSTATLPSHMTMNCCAHCNGEIQLV